MYPTPASRQLEAEVDAARKVIGEARIDTLDADVAKIGPLGRDDIGRRVAEVGIGLEGAISDRHLGLDAPAAIEHVLETGSVVLRCDLLVAAYRRRTLRTSRSNCDFDFHNRIRGTPCRPGRSGTSRSCRRRTRRNRRRKPGPDWA